MGNQVLGRRSRNFYRGFNERQLSYIRDKFQMLSTKEVLDAEKLAGAYFMNKDFASAFLKECGIEQSGGVDYYEFVCTLSSICNLSLQQIGAKLFTILTNGPALKQKDLLLFTSVCLQYNSYCANTSAPAANQLATTNRKKFKKYDYDKSGSIDQKQFIAICLKDQDYKLWLFNMGLITKHQCNLAQDAIYDLVDSDVGQQVDRHLKQADPNADRVKRGVEHRLEDDDFQQAEEQGTESANQKYPWLKMSEKISQKDMDYHFNPNPPSQILTLEHAYGYRSYDCRNNAKFDGKGNLIYHQGSLGIFVPNSSVANRKMQQCFLMEHKNDISCIDVIDDRVVSGEASSKPMVILWAGKQIGRQLKSETIITSGLKGPVGCVRFSSSKQFLAVICNDENHELLVYNLKQVEEATKNLASNKTGIILAGGLTKNLVFDLQFTLDEKTIVVATIKEILFIPFDSQKAVNSSRGVYGEFIASLALCLLPLKSDKKQFMLAGMGNGSIYFWEQYNCVKAVFGHSGSVSALCRRERGFASGDKSGKILLWNSRNEKQRQIQLSKTNCTSTMVLSLSEWNGKLLIGSKSSSLFLWQGDKLSVLVEGHSEGRLMGLAIDKKGFFYTGGEDKRIMKWQYRDSRTKTKEVKCDYQVRALDINESNLLVGYKNGVVEVFSSDLQKKNIIYKGIKNPDMEVLSVVRFDRSGSQCSIGYNHPEFKVGVFDLTQKQFKLLCWVKQTAHILSIDYSFTRSPNDPKFIRVNTAAYDCNFYSLTKDKYSNVDPKQGIKVAWETHTCPFSPETRAVFGQGVSEADISACARSNKDRNVAVVGDKFGRLKLYNFPAITNTIYNKCEGHSNTVASIQFNAEDDYMVSVGAEEKSVLLWKYDSKSVDNAEYINAVEEDEDELISKKEPKDARSRKMDDEFDAVQAEGQQALATNQFKGQTIAPSDFLTKYNLKKDNQEPKETVAIEHTFGVRNKYLKDQVRNQCRFTADFKSVMYPTACMAIKADIKTRKQQIYLQHKEDIVSFAMDESRTLMATGQMAEKNLFNPLKKIVSVVVWDIDRALVLQTLNGFLTIAVVLLSFSPTGKLLFACGNDDKNTFAVYNWKAGVVLYSGPISNAKVNGITWRSEREFMTCGLDHVKFWEEGKGRLGKLNTKKYESMCCCVKSRDVYVSGSEKGNLFNWLGNESSKPIEAHQGKVQCLIVKDSFLYSGGDDGKILRWKLEKNGAISGSDLFYDVAKDFYGKMKRTNFPDELSVLSMDFSDKLELVLVTRGCNVIHYHNGNSRVITQGHYKGQLWGLACNTQSDRFWTAGDDQTARLWDLKERVEVSRVNFEHKVRSIDVSIKGDVIIGDEKAILHLYDSQLTKSYSRYQGQPSLNNAKDTKNNGWIQEIKFDPNGSDAVYGTHGRSQILEFVKIDNHEIKKSVSFKGGSSAVLHIDWSRNSGNISVNTQASQLLFFDRSGKMTAASALRNEQWATWTQKFGWPVKGIFQNSDYSDVNTVCRHPSKSFMAVGYDDQSIRLFKYPCYIQKQVHKVCLGHSSHVTKVRFSQNYMISVGGEDKTIIVWEIDGLMRAAKMEAQAEESDGLDDLDQDIDINSKIMKMRKKKPKLEEFFEEADQGDEFMAVKPWLGAIKDPTYHYPPQTAKPPPCQIKLEYVQGYRIKDCRQNLYYIDRETIMYHAAAVLIQHSLSTNKQNVSVDAPDDLLSIAYNRDKNIAATGSLGPKPLVNVYSNGKLSYQFKAPVLKGVVAVAVSPDGDRLVCAGMDDVHTVTVMGIEEKRVLATKEGGRKVILRVGWVNNNQFVSIGINHYRYWTIEKGQLTHQDGNLRGNFVSLAIRNNRILTGGSNGSLQTWTRNSGKMKTLTMPSKEKEAVGVSVVESLFMEKGYVLAGTKDGYIFVLNDLLDTLKILLLKDMLSSGVERLRSQNTSVRSIDVLGNKLLIGTFGSQIFQFEGKSLGTQEMSVVSSRCIMKCHYCPNNSWTNEVWGLCVREDLIFTCSDDATLRCWSIPEKKLLGCTSLNTSADRIELQKDKKINDFSAASKGRCVAVSPEGDCVIVGSKNGTVRVFGFKRTHGEQSCRFNLLQMFRHAKEWISDIKFGSNLVAIGSHDNAIYIYDYENQTLTKKYKPMLKHSSYITHLDISRDSCYLQSTCGAYQLLFWDLNTGKQITSGGSLLKDERWSSWTCNLGWPVQGIYPKCVDGTFIHSVDRSNSSIKGTVFTKDDSSSYLLGGGNNKGQVCLYSFPCTIKNSSYVIGLGHSSHITNVRWSYDDKYLLSVGGEDQCLMYWQVKK